MKTSLLAIIALLFGIVAITNASSNEFEYKEHMRNLKKTKKVSTTTPSSSAQNGGPSSSGMQYNQSMPCDACINGGFLFCALPPPSNSSQPPQGPPSAGSLPPPFTCCKDSTCAQASNNSYTCSNTFSNASLAISKLCLPPPQGGPNNGSQSGGPNQGGQAGQGNQSTQGGPGGPTIDGKNITNATYNQTLPCPVCISSSYIFCALNLSGQAPPQGPPPNGGSNSAWLPPPPFICCQDSSCSQVSNSSWICSNNNQFTSQNDSIGKLCPLQGGPGGQGPQPQNGTSSSSSSGKGPGGPGGPGKQGGKRILNGEGNRKLSEIKMLQFEEMTEQIIENKDTITEQVASTVEAALKNIKSFSQRFNIL